jgi:hypothetical protein
MLRFTGMVLVLVLAALFGHALGQSKTWRDATGKFSVEAEFVDFKDGKVQLKKKDGTVISIAKERLSKEDQSFIDAAQDRPVKPQSDEKWRRDFKALVDEIKITRTADGKAQIDWGEADELGKWYEVATPTVRMGIKMIDRRFRTPAKINEWKALAKKVQEAHKAIEGVEWTAKTIHVSKTASASSKLDLPPLPQPLEMSFWLAEKDVPNWANVQNGDTIRFTCTFETLTAVGEFPQIYVRMTLKP